MGKVDVYLSLGSNLGSRTGNLEKAMKLLEGLGDIGIDRLQSLDILGGKNILSFDLLIFF